MIAALILDFDGLLMDTETPALESWRHVYAGYGYEITLEMWQSALGSHGGFNALEHLTDVMRQQQPAVSFEPEQVYAERQQIKHQMCRDLALLPGAHALLDAADARGLPMAVASSSDREWVQGWLEHQRIAERFVCIRTAEDVAQTKPAPDLFLQAAACMGVSPARCLVFEDSPNGILAARAAGMPCVAVPGSISRHMPMPPADLLLEALDTLTLAEMLEQIAAARSVAARIEQTD
jgi:HAD superfamily hydrolase (TIGR01509 family)